MSKRLSVSLFLVLIGLAGCYRGPLSWQRVTLNQPITSDQIGFIQDGQTTLTEVVDNLGAPDEIVKLQERLVARYHFTDGKYFRADYGWGLRAVIPIFAPDLILGGGGFGTDVFEVSCDSHLVVQQHAFAFHVNSSKYRAWPFSD